MYLKQRRAFSVILSLNQEPFYLLSHDTSRGNSFLISLAKLLVEPMEGFSFHWFLKWSLVPEPLKLMTTATVEKDHALSNAKAKLEGIIEWHREYQVLTNVPDNDPDARNEDDLIQEAEQSVLSVEYRQSCWQSVGSELTASQGRLLLTWVVLVVKLLLIWIIMENPQEM